ncbi:Alanine--tRNA ligase [secondary endosymbiont of Trabutina mannipara]|uniref:Alanine--tRNA ligase n=1 Tax=secondary endosymbiont of Trabutina mannipara TaxID=1835721 RepID=A0A1C3L439_9ENTR|nr:alanine--tRNA ligase [secondary endosymbiont of Trabutina mannipara]SBT82050.1 Alanine--tRNA ligase [secondary endosymbiont of Trabutina mannipara]
MSNSTDDIRQKFINFFNSKEHQLVASSSLVPNNDPTLLFTNAGMNQFKDVFLGLDNRSYRRATTSQRCVRAGGKHNDLENVGYTTRHHTFFEMLGNFSFGDYFKYDAIRFAWELLTSEQWFNLPKDKLWVTVYATDYESYNIWANDIGVPLKHIIRIGDNKGIAYNSDNFWKMGETGPCGPCSEIFYDHGNHILGNPPGSIDKNGDRYIEIWNLVFMQFNRHTDGTLLLLPKPSVDTGMGLERIAAVLQNVDSNYDIDFFKKIIDAAAWATGTNNLNSKSLRVIADHIRSCAFIISDGVVPSNEGRGYVLRRIIRRALRHGNILGVSNTFFYKLVAPLIEVMGNVAGNLKLQRSIVEQILRTEEEQFNRTIKRGLTLLDEELEKLTGDTLNGETAFRLYDTYGFPLDFTLDICRERNLSVDKAGFKSALEAQRKKARDSRHFSFDYNSHILLQQVEEISSFIGYEQLKHQSIVIAIFRNGHRVNIIFNGEEAIIVLKETPFYSEMGGQIGDQGELKAASGIFQVTDTQKYGRAICHLGKINYGEIRLGMNVTAQVNDLLRKKICLNHSATHLLHAALRQVLGPHIKQKSSSVKDKYLRFDFLHSKAMELEQIRQVEKIVNKQIRRNISIKTEILTLEEACKKGAIALFNDKYVRMLSIGDFSKELCGGTHANRTGDIGIFSITKESGIAANIRRIEAVTGEEAIILFNNQNNLLNQVTKLIKSDSKTIVNKVRALQEHSRQLEKDIQELKNKYATQIVISIIQNVRNIKGVKVLVTKLDNIEYKVLRIMVDHLKNKLGSAVIVLATTIAGKIYIIAGVTKDLIERIKAYDIVIHIAQQVGVKGGGRADIAQASGKNNNTTTLSTVLENVDAIIAVSI